MSPWNKPGSNGNGGDKNPWGQGGRSQGPPDLDEIARKLQQKLSGLFGGGKKGGNGSSGGGDMQKAGGIGIGIFLIIAVVIWISSGIYVVQQGQRGVVLQFGKKSEVTQAGLRWHLPYPIETVWKVDVKRTYRIEIGYRGKVENTVPQESLMLTQDENIVELGFGIQYRIKEPDNYLFNVRNVEATISQAAESAIREVAGNRTMDLLLTGGREEVGSSVKILLQSILDEYETGILITQLKYQQAGPPNAVQAAFDDAVRAREDEVRYKNDAEAYSRKVLQLARGQVSRIEQDAAAYRQQVQERAKGDADRFRRIAIEYAKAPRVTRDRMYLETLEQVMSNTTKIYLDQKGGNSLIYLPLDKLMNTAASSRRSGRDVSDPELHTPTTTPLTGEDRDSGGRISSGRAPR